MDIIEGMEEYKSEIIDIEDDELEVEISSASISPIDLLSYRCATRRRHSNGTKSAFNETSKCTLKYPLDNNRPWSFVIPVAGRL